MTVDAIALRSAVATPLRKALKSDFLRHGALVFGASMLVNVLNYVFNFALSRRLGVEGFADLTSLVGALMILSIPANVLTLIVVKYAATFHAADDKARIRRLSTVLLKGCSVAAAGIFVAGILLRGILSDFLHIPDDASIILTLAIFAIGFVTPAVRGILQGEEDFLRYSISLTLETFLKVFLGVALAFEGFGVAGAMLGWSIATLIALAYTIWAVLYKHGAAADKSVRLALDLRRLIHTTLGVAMANGLLTCVGFMDVLLVKHYFDAKQAGLYAAVNLTGKIVIFLVGFIPAVVLPKAVARAERGQPSMRLLLQAVVLTIAMAGLTLSVFGMMPAKIIVLLAGHAFANAAPFVFQYDAAMGMLALVILLVNYKIGIHHFDFLYALGAVLVCEVAAIAFFHQTLWDIVHILLAGNAFAVLACFYKVGSSVWSRKDVPATQ